MRPAYHSALSEPAEAPARERFEARGCVALAHDILLGLPPEFAACDVFYAEPPWRHGYQVFNARAGARDAPPFGAFCRSLDALARGLAPPVVYVIGRGDRSFFSPDDAAPVHLHRRASPSLAIAYRLALPPGVPTAEDLLDWLAVRYDHVGDFLAGYGRSGRIFAGRGKAFALADRDPRCVGLIAARAAGWFR